MRDQIAVSDLPRIILTNDTPAPAPSYPRTRAGVPPHRRRDTPAPVLTCTILFLVGVSF